MVMTFAAGVWACAATAAPARWVPPFKTATQESVVISMTRAVANIEYSRAQFHRKHSAHLGDRSPETPTGQWLGRIERRIPDSTAAGMRSDVEFVANYDGPIPASIRCDTDLDDDLDNDPDLALYEYPPIPGALAAFASLRWYVSSEGSLFPISWRIRIVLEPIPTGGAVPVYHIQSVDGLVGEIAVDGHKHRAFMFDGNRDGIYSRGFGDGMFVDLNDDGKVDVDPSTEEFLPFGARSQMGQTVFTTGRVARDGTQVQLFAGGGAARISPLKLGEPAPDFGFLDADGSETRLSTLRGHPVIVYFWASWCGACEELAPRLRETYDRYRARGLEVIGISFDDDPTSYRAFQDRHREPWRSIYTGRKFWENPVGRAYRVHAAGAAYLIDPHGNYLGLFYDLDELDRRLDELTQVSPPKR